jgi:hypothetical protein
MQRLSERSPFRPEPTALQRRLLRMLNHSLKYRPGILTILFKPPVQWVFGRATGSRSVPGFDSTDPSAVIIMELLNIY